MEHTVSPQGMAQAAVSRCCQLRDRQDASVCGVAQPSWWLPVSGAVGHWGLVLGPSEETQEDSTCGRAKADPGAAGDKQWCVEGLGHQTRETSLKFQH